MIKVPGERCVGQVQLYALSTCIWCRKAKRLLDENGIEYEYVYVDELSSEERCKVLKKLKKLTDKVSFPITVINGVGIKGFDADRIREACKL